MVRITKDEIDLEHVDFSFIPSLECNNRCWFCMYCASPDNKLTLDLGKTKEFMKTIEWKRISSWGFYGGEPSINMELYQQFIDLVPYGLSKFVITNGRWSLDYEENGACDKFLHWCHKNRLWIKVSGTPEHRKHQNRVFLESYAKLTSEEGFDIIGLKEDDELHPMGRLATDNWTCTQRCKTHPQPIRLAIFPTGDIIMQNCDGVYPVVGTFLHSFKSIYDKAKWVRENGCAKGTWNINDVLALHNVLSRNGGAELCQKLE